jgi:hypothetical protein
MVTVDEVDRCIRGLNEPQSANSRSGGPAARYTVSKSNQTRRMGRFWIRYVGATSASDLPINVLRAPSRLGADREAVRQWSEAAAI